MHGSLESILQAMHAGEEEEEHLITSWWQLDVVCQLELIQQQWINNCGPWRAPWGCKKGLMMAMDHALKCVNELCIDEHYLIYIPVIQKPACMTLMGHCFPRGEQVPSTPIILPSFSPVVFSLNHSPLHRFPSFFFFLFFFFIISRCVLICINSNPKIDFVYLQILSFVSARCFMHRTWCNSLASGAT